jgi:hypothetical protein
MPYKISNRGGKFVVTKKAGVRVLGTHGRIEDAKAQLRALYAKESAPSTPKRKPAARAVGAASATGKAHASSKARGVGLGRTPVNRRAGAKKARESAAGYIRKRNAS